MQRIFSGLLFLIPLGNITFFLLVDINRCTVRECDAIGAVEGFQIDSPITDARLEREKFIQIELFRNLGL